MPRFRSLYLLGALGYCAACRASPPPAISEADRQAIRSVAESALAIGNASHRDWLSYARAYYAEDAISMPAGSPAQHGPAAIAAAQGSDTASFNIRWQLLEIDGYYDLAYVRGRWWLSLPTSQGLALADSGNYLEVWRRQPSGVWRVARDMYSSEVPPPEP